MLKQLFTSRIEDILNKSAPFGEIKSFKPARRQGSRCSGGAGLASAPGLEAAESTFAPG